MSPNLNFISRLRNRNNKNEKVLETVGLGNNAKIHLLDGVDEKQKKVVIKTAINKNDLKIESDAMEELSKFRQELKNKRELNPDKQNELLLLGSSHVAKLCRSDSKDSINIRFIEGSTIRTLYKESATKPNIEDSYSILVQTLAGLKFINEKMEHNDISSRNIMLDTKGKVKIIDFGRATKDPQKKGEDLHCLYYVTELMKDNYNQSKDHMYPNLAMFFKKFNPRSFYSYDQIFEKLKQPELSTELEAMMKNNQNPYFKRILKC